jgi:cobalt-zinc-cadmium efflux system membrane fusion protein
MKMKITFISIWLVLFCSCTHKEKNKIEIFQEPVVKNNGQIIIFPDSTNLLAFKTEELDGKKQNAELTAPAKIVATVVSSTEDKSQNIILFQNPDLSNAYMQLIQHQINIKQIRNVNIKQRKIELERIKDLQQHGASTGQDLLNAESALSIEVSNLNNENAAFIENEASLISAGFAYDVLSNSNPGTVYLICDIPENQISNINIGQICTIVFSAFPDEKYYDKIDAIAEMVDNSTRMVKVRISMKNQSNKLKSGMFANVFFNLSESDFMSVHQSALVTVQGKTYVFIKRPNHTFERTEIQIGPQIGDRVIVYKGLKLTDEIVVDGVMQLKGLSFGY